MRRFSKRGISPVIATTLLVGLAVIIAFIIFLWAKSTLAEQYLKFNEPVERSCEGANFGAEIYTEGGVKRISVVNRGTVPIYGFKMLFKASGELKEIGDFQCDNSGTPITLENGESCVRDATTEISANAVILFIPQILAERGNQEVPYTCDKSFGEEVNAGP